MSMWSNKAKSRSGGFLTRLARDVRANTLVIMTMALIPLAGMVGGGLDLSRMYILKTRLQHACDAGALAGRKAMGGGTWASNSNYANTQALKFFDGNFKTGQFASYNMTRSFAESAGKVTGTVQATIPMTLMKIFRIPDQTIPITCEAEMRLPNTDVMFVLDTTGSMNCVAGDTSCSNNGGVPANGSKIDGLKVAVKCFYEIVAKLDTDANCVTGTPSGGTGNQVQIRFGFVPYASNVNVGRLLPNSYFPDSAVYQSREANWDPPGTTNSGAYYEQYRSGTAISKANCLSYMKNEAFGSFSPTSTSSGGPSPATSYSTTFNSDGDATAGDEWGWSGASTTSGTNRSCRRSRTDYTTTYVPQFRDWTYKPTTLDLRGLKNGTGWNANFTLPLGANGANRTITWDGCIEERQTVRALNYSPVPSGAKDLDIDALPQAGDPSTMWKPALDEVIYLRSVTSNYSQATTNTSTTTTNYYNGVSYSCPTQAKLLQQWPSASDFDDYVDSLKASGNTYHDIGMIWGGRLMTPGDAYGNGGLFAATNKLTPQGGEIQRHMIFMTDGDSTSNPCDYNAYGVPWYDQRQTTDVGSASNCPYNRQQLIDQINLRLEALCTVIKNHNITLWVVSYGGGSSTDTENRLKNCATSGKYFQATSASALQNAFKTIADQISMLRLTN